MKKILIFLVLVLPVLALLWFSLTRNPRDLPSALIGRPAPDFTLSTLEGKKISLDEAKGNPVVLNFWSTWCGPCVGGHQLIREAIRIASPSGVRFYSVLYEDTVENASRFIEQYGKAAPILLDPGLRTAIDYGVSGVPETFFISRDGIIVAKQSGMLVFDFLMENIKKLVEERTK